MQKYEREEVQEKSDIYFKGDLLASKVWVNKYSLKDSIGNIYELTPDDMHKRMSGEIARIESKYPNPLSEEEIFGLMENFKYLVPQGGSMSGIGNDLQTVSISNCFVVGNDSDSYGGISNTDQEQVQLMKRRGGVGHDLSHIRPKGSIVKNSALTSTGVVPFMERYSNSTREVAQDGRRGALMLSISIKHPDSEAFIDAKMESGKVTGANVSVKIDDEFMRSVIGDKKYSCQFPINSTTPTIKKEIDSKKLWDKIIHNAWKSAEPGILFWDKIISEAIPDMYGSDWKTVSTNPCFRGDMLLLTDKGYKTFNELDGKTVNLIDSNGLKNEGHIWCTGEKDIYEVKSYGKSIFCTENHIFKTINGDELEAKNLKGKRIKQYVKLNDKINEYVNYGFIQGDGALTRLNSEKHLGLEVNIGVNDGDILELFNVERGEKDQRKFYVNGYNDILKELEFDVKVLPERNLPNTFSSWTHENKSQFLKGLFSANGSVIKKTRISFKTTSKKLVTDLLNILKEEYGIISYITTNKAKVVKFENGDYECKESYDLNISRFESVIKFAEEISFVHKYKIKALSELIDVKSPLILSVKFKEIGNVYDFNIHGENHWGVVNGCISHNCGEIPLCPYDSCRLLAINLYSYVNNPFTLEAAFDFELFKKHTKYGQKIMDDIVDLEIEKIDAILNKIKTDPEPDSIKLVEKNLWEKIKEKATLGRRTGLGVTAEGDMLAAIGLTYGTEEANNFSELVHKTMAISAYESSITMARERGCFPIWNLKTEFNNPFIQRVYNELPEEAKNDYKTYGRRNIAALTAAPTGTVSLMTETTSGIEPVFAPVYVRRRKINPNDKNSCTDFIDEVGDHWEEYNVFHPKFKIWAEINGYNIEELEAMKISELEKVLEKSPYYKATANDVDWVEKVKMQGLIQKWIDHSISVTVNLPQSATEELVSSVYKMGWESGCKGITVYRDGSRSGVLVTKTDTPEKKEGVFIENNAPKRPKTLKCDVIRFTNKGEKWIGFLGVLNDRPIEVFTGLQDAVGLPLYIETGEIVKIKLKDNESRYDFIYVDKDGYQQEFRGLGRAFNREYWNVGVLLSGILRHGMPIPNVISLIEKLNFDNSESITSWENGVKRMLKKYIKDGTKTHGETCPECGSSSIIYVEGCKKCSDCGYAHCG